MSGIVTLTMNPALDITTSTKRVAPTEKLRCAPPRSQPGGGGIIVARVVQVLGGSATAVFPAGGPSGKLFETLVAAEGVVGRCIHIDGATRESFTVGEEQTGQEYRFVLPGPQLTTTEQESCLAMLAEAARDVEYVVASGSLPPGVSPDFYQRVAAIARERGARLILDTSGRALRHMRSDVYLLKPSIRELRDCVGRKLLSEHDQLVAARELIGAGVTEVVVLSLGEQGALMVTAQGHERVPAIEVPAGSGVGAGDSMLAAITVGLSRGWALGDAVRLGIAAGAAMLMTPGTQACRRQDVEDLYAGITDKRGRRRGQPHGQLSR